MHCRAKRWEHSTNPRHEVEQRGYDLIGTRLKDLRTATGLTQRRLEDLTGIDQTVISRLENGRQYGLRWSRYAILVAVLDERQPERMKPVPWWVTLGITPPPAWHDRLRAEGLMPPLDPSEIDDPDEDDEDDEGDEAPANTRP